jgi:NTP pyrophosphatase (non-canonical NTP hydrolase)
VPEPQPTSGLTLEAFQQHIHKRYYQADSDRGTSATFMWFIEEVGELATALHRVSGGNGSSTQGDEVGLAEENRAAARRNLEEEFADVLAWLCTLANINDVDLADAVHHKYLTGEGPVGHK